MQAIRKKISRIGLHLDQLQDFGGCRVILSHSADVYKLVEVLENRSRHDLRRPNDYIERPRETGYRSYHMIFEYAGRGPAEVFTGRKIEVQIRTSLQHAWSTAVEAIGTIRGEELKSGQGNPDWLRLLLLMSAEMAELENCSPPPGVNFGRERVEEIRELSHRLKALEALQNARSAALYASDALQYSKPTYYLIRYNNETGEVDVKPQSAPQLAVKSYDQAEQGDNERDTERENIVLVEADKIETLRAAFPNYFGDVAPIKDLIEKIVTQGVGLRDYHVRLQERVKISPKPQERANLTWFRRRMRWR